MPLSDANPPRSNPPPPGDDRLARFVHQRPSWISWTVNIVLFLLLGGLAVKNVWDTWQGGYFNYVEASFAIQTLVLLAVILVRRPHRTLDTVWWHQLVALAAFGSGVFFIGQPPSGGPAAQWASDVVVFVSNVLATIVTLNLGRSFGILIALRQVRTTGLYAVIRHPMFMTDILLRIGYLISHLSPATLALFGFSTGAYVWRALLEEQFLSQDPAYRAYMQQVRWRLLPFVF